MYRLENLSFGYQEPIFQNVTLQINESKIGIIGENGIGKTTLLKIFNNELVPRNGKVVIDKATYRVNFDLEKYKRFTISDFINIVKKMRSFDCTHLDKYLDLLNLHKYLEFPIGQLSKGTAKKVSLLLGFLTKDRVLLLDEPFEALDEKTNHNLVDVFSNTDRNLIIVSHDYNMLKESVDIIYEVADKTLKAR